MNEQIDNELLLEWIQKGETLFKNPGLGFRIGAWWADRPWRNK